MQMIWENRVQMRTVVRDVNGSTKPFNPKLRIFSPFKGEI